MAASTRRAAIGAILAVPLASAPMVAATAVSPALVALIAEHDRINAALDASGNDWGPSLDQSLIRSAGSLRGKIAAFPTRGWPDTMAKAACLARVWTIEGAEEELQSQIGGGYAYLADMALAIACEVMRHGEAWACA